MGETLDSLTHGAAFAGACLGTGAVFIGGAVGLYNLAVKQGCHVIDAENDVIQFFDNHMPGGGVFEDSDKGVCELQDDIHRLSKKAHEREKSDSSNLGPPSPHAENAGRIILAERDKNHKLILRWSDR